MWIRVLTLQPTNCVIKIKIEADQHLDHAPCSIFLEAHKGARWRSRIRELGYTDSSCRATKPGIHFMRRGHLRQPILVSGVLVIPCLVNQPVGWRRWVLNRQLVV
jgi:hypothetical protein